MEIKPMNRTTIHIPKCGGHVSFYINIILERSKHTPRSNKFIFFNVFKCKPAKCEEDGAELPAANRKLTAAEGDPKFLKNNGNTPPSGVCLHIKMFKMTWTGVFLNAPIVELTHVRQTSVSHKRGGNS
jgi:hypothetical protein